MRNAFDNLKVPSWITNLYLDRKIQYLRFLIKVEVTDCNFGEIRTSNKMVQSISSQS